MTCISCHLIHPNRKHCLLHGPKKMPSCFPFSDKRGCFSESGVFFEILSEAIAPGGFQPMGFLYVKNKEME